MPPAPPEYDVGGLGQVFTPPAIVEAMLVLVRNCGRVLEPACGDGAFLKHFPFAMGIELDARYAPPGARVSRPPAVVVLAGAAPNPDNWCSSK